MSLLYFFRIVTGVLYPLCGRHQLVVNFPRYGTPFEAAVLELAETDKNFINDTGERGVEAFLPPGSLRVLLSNWVRALDSRSPYDLWLSPVFAQNNTSTRAVDRTSYLHIWANVGYSSWVDLISKECFSSHSVPQITRHFHQPLAGL